MLIIRAVQLWGSHSPSGDTKLPAGLQNHQAPNVDPKSHLLNPMAFHRIPWVGDVAFTQQKKAGLQC